MYAYIYVLFSQGVELIRWWKNLSIAKKLHALVAIMVVMVGFQVFIFQYAVTTLSALRVFNAAIAQWNDSQKNSIFELYQYALTGQRSHYWKFKDHLKVPAGYKKARLGFEACKNIKECKQLDQIAEGFKEGKIPSDDIPRLIRTIRHLRGFPHMSGAVDLWRSADGLLDDIERVGDDLDQLIQSGVGGPEAMEDVMDRIKSLNHQFTDIQRTFTLRMANGSRFLERAIVVFLILVMFFVGGVSVYLIYRLVSYLNEHIEEVKEVAARVGKGDFSKRIRVTSKDGLGQMAERLNQMIEELEMSIGKKVKAESASQIKTLFLANMSHEVRTPLGVIMGMIEILKDKSLSESDREKYISIVEQTGKNLQQIINDILDISKVEAGHLDIEKTQFRLEEFLSDICRHFQVLAERAKNELIFKMDGDLPEYIVSDQGRVRQILTNLIGNSLKFTHEGRVVVTCLADEGGITFRVQDSGLGIPKKEQCKLFKAFSQVDHSSSRKYGGTGLGLLLSKKLAQSLGGDVKLDVSRPGVGSIFSFRLPTEEVANSLEASKGSSAEKEKFNEDRLAGKKILLVEDSPEVQLLIQLFLKKKGVNVEFANNGKEGMEKALFSEHDLILMDMQMPMVDGYSATEQLRMRGFNTPIIALTAHAMKEDRERCLRVGCNDYMTKPIDPPQFYQTLASYVQ